MGLRRRAADDAPRVVGFDFDRLAAGAPPPAAPPVPAAPAWAENPFSPEPSYAPPAFAAAAPSFAPPSAPAYAPTPAPPPPPGYLPPASHWQQPPGPPAWDLPAPARRGSPRNLAGIAVAVVLLAGGVAARGYRMLDGVFGGVSTPSTLAGATLMREGPIADDLRDSVDPLLGPFDDVVLAVYEDGGVPAYVLIAAENDGVDVAQMHKWFTAGARTQGASVSDLTPFGDVSCANVALLGVEVSTCFWANSSTAGYVMDITGNGADDTARVTRLARSGVEK